MTEYIKTKVTIAGRVYPLRIAITQHNQVMQVVERIQRGLDQLESQYQVRDKQDVLAMYLLQVLSNKEVVKEDQKYDRDTIKKLGDMNQLLDLFLEL